MHCGWPTAAAGGRYVPTDRRVGGPRSTCGRRLRGLGCELATQAQAAVQTTAPRPSFKLSGFRGNVTTIYR